MLVSNITILLNFELEFTQIRNFGPKFRHFRFFQLGSFFNSRTLKFLQLGKFEGSGFKYDILVRLYLLKYIRALSTGTPTTDKFDHGIPVAHF